MKEGHYRFLFNNSKELHQLFVKNTRCYDGCLPKYQEHEIIEDSWNNARRLNVNGSEFIERIMTNDTEVNKQWVTTMMINESNMDPGFLNCISLLSNFTNLYETSVRTKGITCQINHKQN